MKIERVTFTGADESVKPEDILRVVDEYPTMKTEWALLLSKSNEGKQTRYPSLEWMEEFTKQCLPYLSGDTVKMYLAGHIQGHWLRTMAEGKPTCHIDRSAIWPFFDRIQLNFHGMKTIVAPGFFVILFEKQPQYIFQMDGVNERIYHDAHAHSAIVNLVPLFDLSAGAGIVPEFWPKPIHPSFNGYAGGLGPDTIKEQLKRLEDVVGDGLIWIDMETRIRSEDDRQFDLDKCRRVLDVVRDKYGA